MRKDKFEEIGYLVLTIAITIFLILSISKMSAAKIKQETKIINTKLYSNATK